MEQGWRGGESTRLSPMWPGFDSCTRRHMWVDFVVDSLLAPRGFSLGPPVFPSSSSKSMTFPNSNSIRNPWANMATGGLSVVRLLSATLVKQSRKAEVSYYGRGEDVSIPFLPCFRFKYP